MDRQRGRFSERLSAGPRRLVVVLRPGANARRSREVVRWIRALLPAAILLIGPGPSGMLAGDDDDPVLTVDADSVRSGPLALADALTRNRGT
jgi:anti-sigma factor RsiW